MISYIATILLLSSALVSASSLGGQLTVTGASSDLPSLSPLFSPSYSSTAAQIEGIPQSCQGYQAPYDFAINSLQFASLMERTEDGTIALPKFYDDSLLGKALDAFEDGDLRNFLKRQTDLPHIKTACTVGAGAMLFMKSSPMRWMVALGVPVAYAAAKQVLEHVRGKPLDRQIDAQLHRKLPRCHNTARIAKYLADLFGQEPDPAGGVRDINDADVEIYAPILLWLDRWDHIVAIDLIHPATPLYLFGRMIVSRQGTPVELVARFVNGRVVYLVATYQRLSEHQQRLMLSVVRDLNGVSDVKDLRQFKCKNFIQRTMQQQSRRPRAE